MMFELRDYQKQASDAAVRFFSQKPKHNAIMVLPTGSGKSLIVADIASKLSEPTLVFQPSKEILEQNYKKLLSYDILDCSIYSASMNRKEISRITFATIGSAINNKEAFSHFRNVIIDECFPAGSLVDGRPIEEIKVGEYVNSLNHTSNKIERKRVVGILQKPLNGHLVKVLLSDKTSFICTDNHPIYIEELGYISPKELLTLYPHLYEKNTSILLHLRKRNTSTKSFWRANLLQRRMRDRSKKEKEEKTGNNLCLLRKGGSNNRNPTSERTENGCLLLLSRMWTIFTEKAASPFVRKELGKNQAEIKSENESKQPNVDERDKGKNDSFNEREKIQRKGRKRKTNHTTNSSSISNWLSDRICYKYRFCKTFISETTLLLQSGFGFSSKENCNRDRRKISPTSKSENKRREENSDTYLVRLESIEIYEHGDRFKPGGLRSNNYVYNLEVKDNNNYFVNETLVHNCHFVNAKQGQYLEFLEEINVPVLGLTATPYRLSSTSFGSILKFLTRTRPRVFKEVIYYSQIGELLEKGFLAKLEYYQVRTIRSENLVLNSTKADYTDKSVRNEYGRVNFKEKSLEIVERLIKAGRENILVFTRFIEESEFIVNRLEGLAEIVTGETPKKERERILEEFKSGQIRVICNVGVLTTGFDFPELSTVVLARPTMSLSLYYQMIGRCIRPHSSKKSGWIIDLCENFKRFGKVEELVMAQEKQGIWFIKNKEEQLTNIYFS